MGQVTLTLNGRTYSVGCGDGEEERLRSLGAHLREKLESLVREFGQAGEARLFLLASLLIADELLEARAERDTAASTAAAAVLREIADRNRPEPKTAAAEAPPLATLASRPPAPAPSAPAPPAAKAAGTPAVAPSAAAKAQPPPTKAEDPADAIKPAVSALQAAINRAPPPPAAETARKTGAA